MEVPEVNEAINTTKNSLKRGVLSRDKAIRESYLSDSTGSSGIERDTPDEDDCTSEGSYSASIYSPDIETPKTKKIIRKTRMK
ncbi:hypothetical protein EVAR_23600_1 [Eumeta japonica]|uniref:Uncharacterized protein n=1 Tax=Eumeta variegata TaxID=151549 RepID=A0A4C1WXR8_EUMVA|nr:hypothetical protein EVAR_23600_1 [Eumeta japonica]